MYTPYEDMLWALKDTVIATVGAKLTAIEVEKADGISLPDFKSYGMGYRNPFSVTQWPYVMFIHDTGSIEESGIHGELERLHALVMFVLKSKNRDSLTKMDFRYADAIRGVIDDDIDLGGAVLEARVIGIDWSPAAEDLSVGVVRVEILEEILR
jgi:hypothetical protein